MNWYKTTKTADENNYYKCPNCNAYLAPEYADSDLYGPGWHKCVVCDEIVLPIGLRKVPKDKRLDMIRKYM